MHELIASIDEARRLQGFLTVEGVLALRARGVTVFDPFSTLVSNRAELAAGVFLWPNVTIMVGETGSVSVGSSAVLHSGTRVVAQAGSVSIGSNCDIGQEGGFTFIADNEGDVIAVGDNARLNGGGSIAKDAQLGDGAQVLGPIRVQQCRLGGGGSYREPDPDKRGGVLKGSGIARNLDIPAGMVVQAFGLFGDAPLRHQRDFHPGAKTAKS